MNEDQKKKLDQIRAIARQGKCKFAPQEQISYLQDTIRLILGVLAEVLDCPGMAKAWVSDQSNISDFLRCKNRGEGGCLTSGVLTEFCECDYSEELQKISEQLGVVVSDKDYLTTVARRMMGLV